MSISSGLISAPVTNSDINAALGASHTDVASMCCSPYTNIWSKYKSVPKNKSDTTDELNSDKTWKSSATWWKGNNGNCGVTYKSDITTVAGARSAINTEMNIWSHDAPSGGVSSPYRVTDFNQYYALAAAPTTQCGASDAQLQAGAVLTISVATSMDDGYSLKLNDVGSFENYYYLAALFTKSGTLVLLHTSSQKVGQYAAGETIEITIPYNNGNYGYQGKLTEGTTYDCYVMLSSVQYTCATSGQNGTYIPLPVTGYKYGMKPCDVRCLQSSQYASVDATASGRLVNWTIRLYGAGAPSAVTVQLIYASTRQPVSGQTKTINFANGAVAITGGYQRSNTMQETLTCPDDNIDNYMFEFIYNTIDVKAIIGRDIQV